MEELFVITDGGQLLFSWHPEGTPKEEGEKDDLISGFLTALNTFATYEKGEDLKTLKMKETTIIFEKNEDFIIKLTFVITTKNDELIELCHSIVHDIMNNFIDDFKEVLQREFDGEVTKFVPFNQTIKHILQDHGFDALVDFEANTTQNEFLKSIIFLEPKSGHIFYINAKQYVNKEKISFLAPLIVNSSQLLYKRNLNENSRWILLNTVRNEILLVDIRKKMLVAKQFQLEENYEEDLLSLDFFKTKDRYVKKPRKVINIFENLIWDEKIKQIYLVDMVGKILYTKIIDPKYDCTDYIPEAISFLTSTKKASIEIYNRVLFNATIGGEQSLSTICINFNNFALILIGNVQELSDFKTIQNICANILIQLK